MPRKPAAENFFLINLFGLLQPIKKPALQSAENERWTAVQTRMRLREAAILSNGKKRANLLSLIRGRVVFWHDEDFFRFSEKNLRNKMVKTIKFFYVRKNTYWRCCAICCWLTLWVWTFWVNESSFQFIHMNWMLVVSKDNLKDHG